MNLVGCALLTILMLAVYSPANAKDPPGRDAIHALILVDDLYGGNLNIEDNENCILENFAAYGWEVTLASCTPEVNPCSWAEIHGCDVLTADMLTNELDYIGEWDLVMVAPGEGHEHLMQCPFALNIISQAYACNVPISAWCKGVRVLAAADVLEGVSITGHAAFEEEYIAAGANYLGNAAPPTIDDGIITCVKGKQYRQEMCELIRDAVENATHVDSRLTINNKKLCFKLFPNPISTSTTVEFMLDDPQNVQIALFDQNGNMVLDVVKQKFNAGRNRVHFSPANLPSGVYYLYLFAGEKREMRKCMII